VSESATESSAFIDLYSSIANSTNSPLLQLPAETRTMIFKYAVRPTYGWIGLYFNRQNLISRSHSSVQGHKSELKDIAVHLPVVCRQVYAETVTLIYSHNCFAFQSESSMKLWLDKRLLAQREAIRWMMLPCFVYEHRVYDGNDWEWKYETEDVADRMRKICPNLIEMEEDDWLDECIYLRDYQDRGADPSSGDENPYERE